MKLLLKRFHLNGHTIRFCSQTQKLDLNPKQIQDSTILNYCLSVFILDGLTLGFRPQTSELELHVPSTLQIFLNDSKREEVK